MFVWASTNTYKLFSAMSFVPQFLNAITSTSTFSRTKEPSISASLLKPHFSANLIQPLTRYVSLSLLTTYVLHLGTLKNGFVFSLIMFYF